PATIARHLAVLSNLFNTARKEWAIEVQNPVEGIKKPIVRNARNRRISAEEIDAILAATQRIIPIAASTLYKWIDEGRLRRFLSTSSYSMRPTINSILSPR